MSYSYPYYTSDEIDFLGGLGSFNTRDVIKVSRKELLIRYIESMSIRSNWGKIDKEKVTFEAKRMLEEEILK